MYIYYIHKLIRIPKLKKNGKTFKTNRVVQHWLYFEQWPIYIIVYLKPREPAQVTKINPDLASLLSLYFSERSLCAGSSQRVFFASSALVMPLTLPCRNKTGNCCTSACFGSQPVAFVQKNKLSQGICPQIFEICTKRSVSET